MTHIILADVVTRRGANMAACGEFIFLNQESAYPTCPRCAAILSEREAEDVPTFLRDDNDARRI